MAHNGEHDECSDTTHSFGALFTLDAACLIVVMLMLIFIFGRNMQYEYLHRDDIDHQKIAKITDFSHVYRTFGTIRNGKSDALPFARHKGVPLRFA